MSNTDDILLDKVRAFFKRIRWRKILTFSFFVFLSSIFWMMQIYRQKFEVTYVIPLKYVNIPDSVVFETELPTVITTRIKDDGATLFRYYFAKRNDSLEIDIRKMIHESQSQVIQGRVFEQIIRGKLFLSSELMSYSPAQLSYAYAVLQQKKLAVIYDGYINLAAGYIIDGDFITYPDSVIAYGSKASLDTISFAHTVGDTIDNVTSSRNITVAIKPIRGIRFIPNKVELSIPVDEFTSKEIEVPVTCVNLPNNLNIRFFPSTVKVPFFVGLKRHNEIKPDDFKVIVDYDEIKNLEDPSSSIPVRLITSPDYIRTKLPIPGEVEFVLEKE